MSLPRTAAFGLSLLAASSAHALEAFPPTAAGVNEIKTLPAGILLRSETGEGDYFDHSNRLFRPLFRYIDARDIAMTTPVEARVTPGQMFFWVAPSEAGKVDGNSPGVTVLEIPERLVASRGGRGGYSRGNFDKTRAELEAWLAATATHEPAGDAYPVYWNGPATPWFAKRFEVHIPVRARPTP